MFFFSDLITFTRNLRIDDEWEIKFIQLKLVHVNEFSDEIFLITSSDQHVDRNFSSDFVSS